MFSKYVALFLLIGFAQQGFATNKQYEDSYDDYIVYADTALQVFAQTTGLKGFAYCRTLIVNAITNVRDYFTLVAGFIPEAREAWRIYRECDTVTDADAAQVCRVAARTDYIDQVRSRFSRIGQTIYNGFANTARLPFCIFQTGYY